MPTPISDSNRIKNECSVTDPEARLQVLSRSGIQRIALMGGAYGSLAALNACVSHSERIGCDCLAFLGDSTGCCGHSDETVAIIRKRFSILVAGNHEQQAASKSDSCGCNYASAEDEHFGSLAHRYAMESLSDSNREWLGTWPDLTLLQTTAGKLLLCHGSPVQTNEFLYESQLDDRRLETWLDKYDARGMICTHTGFPWLRPLSNGRFAMNCGVIGRPDHDHDVAVHYASIEIRNGQFHNVGIERVEYDHLAWANQLYEEGVDDVFTTPIRNGVWTCGLQSAPAAERVLRSRTYDRLITV